MAGTGSLCARTRVQDQPNRWGIIVVLASHINIALVEGSLCSCSVFYLSWRSEFDTNAKETAAIFSAITAVLNLSVLLGGVMVKRFGCKQTGVIGGLLTSCGMLGSVWVQTISQLYLTSVITGVGMGIISNVALVAVALHFKKGYKTANALAYSGCGTGRMVAPPLTQLLLDGFGLRGALLIISAIVANTVTFSTLYRKPGTDRKPGLDHSAVDGVTDTQYAELQSVQADATAVPETSERIISNEESDAAMHKLVAPINDEKGKSDGFGVNIINRPASRIKLSPFRKIWSELELGIFRKSYRFSMLCPLVFVSMIPYFAADVFIIPRAQSIGVAPSSAAFLLSMNGIGALVGRLVNGLLISCKLSAEIVCSICMAVAGASILLLNADSYVCMSVAATLLGLFTGVLYSLFIVLIRRFVGCRRFSVCLGIYYGFVGFGGLFGPVAAGWVFDSLNSYKSVFYVLAAVYFMCSSLMFVFPVLKRVEPGVVDQQTNEGN